MQRNIFICFVYILNNALALRISADLDPEFHLEDPWISDDKHPLIKETGTDCAEPPNTIFSASRPDGFGEQYINQMLALAFSRKCKGCYRFKHFNPFLLNKSTTLEHDPFEANSFVGLKNDAHCTGNHHHLMMYGINQVQYRKNRWMLVQQLFSKQIRDELRAMYLTNEKMNRDSDCEVVIHDRRGDAKLNSTVQFRSIGNKRLKSTIQHEFAGNKVCIISQGEPEEFGVLATMPNVKLKLSDSTPEAFHNMVTAPKLVIGHSSMSWAAAILRTGPVYHFPYRKGTAGYNLCVMKRDITCQGSFAGMWLAHWIPL